MKGNVIFLKRAMALPRMFFLCSIAGTLFSILALNSPAQESVAKLRVVTDQANVRLKPDIGSVIIHQFPKGTVIHAAGKEGEWFRISFSVEGKETVSGYVHESLVVEIEPIARDKKKEESQKEPAAKKKEPSPPPSQTVRTPPQIEAPPKIFSPKVMPRAELYLSGGGSFLSGGDLNKGAQGLSDFYGSLLSLDSKSGVSPVHLSTLFGGELHIPLFSRISLGIGADYLSGSKETLVEYQSSSPKTLKTRPRFQAVPVRLVLSYSPVPSFYAKSGLEYYFAKCSYFYRFQEDVFWQEWQGEATARGTGILGGFGFVKQIVSPLSVFIEITGRYARIKGFRGKDRYSDSTGSSSSEEGLLYIYQGQITEYKSYPLLFIREKKPTEPGVLNPEQATVDFSGIALKAGIKIRF